MQITYRVPSDKIRYGYIEVTIGADSTMPEPEILAAEYMEFVSKFQMGEARYVNGKIEAAKPEPQAASPLDVVGMGAPDDVEAAAVDMVVDGLGATEVPADTAPWEQPEEEPTVQPWEAAAPVAKFDWS